MNIYLNSFLLLIVLLLSYQLIRRFKIVGIVVSIFPFIAFPFWPVIYHGAFLWLKLYTMSTAIVLLTLLRYTTLSKRTFLLKFIYPILILNIAEVVIVDIVSSNYLNAVAGFLLIITFPKIKIKELSSEKNRDILWDIPLWWVICFTVWDLVFILNTFPSVLLTHAAILGAPLVIFFFNKKTWLQARAYTLGIYLIAYFSFPDIARYTLIPRDSSLATNYQYIHDIANPLSLILATSYAIFYFYNKFKKQKIIHQSI